nr:HAD hydrolase-like protein [Bacteroidales bacterium]
LQKTGASVADSVVIGDDLEVDIKGANTIGLDTVWFNTVNKTANRPVTYEINHLCKLKDIF